MSDTDTTDVVLAWQDPPPDPDQPTPRHLRLAAELRANPGRWALVAQSQGISLDPWWLRLDDMPGYEVRRVYKSRASSVVVRPYDVYARYNPEALALAALVSANGIADDPDNPACDPQAHPGCDDCANGRHMAMCGSMIHVGGEWQEWIPCRCHRFLHGKDQT